MSNLTVNNYNIIYRRLIYSSYFNMNKWSSDDNVPELISLNIQLENN